MIVILPLQLFDVQVLNQLTFLVRFFIKLMAKLDFIPLKSGLKFKFTFYYNYSKTCDLVCLTAAITNICSQSNSLIYCFLLLIIHIKITSVK